MAIDTLDMTAAQELRQRLAGRRTFDARWNRHIVAKERTDRDVKLRPAGYGNGRVWREHRCPAETEESP